jgi:hypothetical protein
MPKPLPDVDLALYEPSTNCLLYCQLKSVTGPDEADEIMTCVEKERRGLEQAASVQEFVRSHSEDAWKRCFPNRPFSNPRIHHAVIMEGFHGSAQCKKVGIPTVEVEHFHALLRQRQSLEKVAETLTGFAYLPIEGVDYRDGVLEHEFGKFRIIWEAYGIPVTGQGTDSE